MNPGRLLVELLVLGCILITTSHAQISRAGASHLDARQVYQAIGFRPEGTPAVWH